MLLVDQYYKPVVGASQPEVDRAYLLLERNGFAVDVPYFNQQRDLALQDKVKAQEKLHTIYRNTVPQVGKWAMENSQVDKIWTSPTRLIELLHTYMEIEPSPIWAKGEVNQRKGETKTDQVALKYLAATNKQHKPLIDAIIDLRRINSSLKYLKKIPGFVDPHDDLIHPIYGAESDTAEKTGANSGRSTMKSPEGQQITNSKDKDHYGIRKGFISPWRNGKKQKLVVRDYAAMEAVLLHAICLFLFNDSSLAGTNDPNVNFHSENARNVFGKYLNWSHPAKRCDGKYCCGPGRVVDFGLDEFELDPWLKDRRRDAKTVFYGLQFCKGARGFGYTLLDSDGEPIGEEKGRLIVNAFMETRPALRKWQEWVFNYLLSFKDRDDTWMPGIGGFSGRWRNVTELVDAALKSGKIDSRFRKAWRQLCNHPEQEGGAAIKTTALVHLHIALAREFGPAALVQNDIHDELITRCDEDIVPGVGEVMQDVMENTYELPCDVKLRTAGAYGDNWMDAK